MNDQTKSSSPIELDRIAERLRDERPPLPAAMRERVSARLDLEGRRHPVWGTGLRSRLAVVLLVAFGVLFGSGGLAMGLSALQDSDNAAVAQYGDCPETDASVCGDVLGGGTSGDDGLRGNPGDSAGPGPSGDVVQSGPQQAAASLNSLPFTGYLAVPALLLGLLLIGIGLLTRRAAREE